MGTQYIRRLRTSTICSCDEGKSIQLAETLNNICSPLRTPVTWCYTQGVSTRSTWGRVHCTQACTNRVHNSHLEMFLMYKIAPTPAYVTPIVELDKTHALEERYRATVRLPMWSSNNTYPDIADTIRAASSHNENPSSGEWQRTFRVFEYLNSTVESEITSQGFQAGVVGVRGS